jgi:hypothetical protein
MNRKSPILTLLIICSLAIIQSCVQTQKVSFSDKSSERKIDVLIDGKLITSYSWPENVYKPVLYPVYTTSGTEITRGFPLKPRAGERNDHIHQVGIWLNYGNVNGFDFWGNGSTGKRSENGGEIKHLGIEKMKDGNREGLLAVKAAWLDPAGKELMTEKTEYHFIATGSGYYIDRITSLTATGGTIQMKDTKEGMFAIRVARQLELPSKENAALMDASLKPGTEKASENKGVTGNYLSSEGVTGEAVWSTRAKWMELTGTIGNENISVVICDHPKNPGYPTYWHARGYGLFSANPLGASDFTQGKQIMNFSIPAGQTITFRYRVAVKSGTFLKSQEINDLAREFSGLY